MGIFLVINFNLPEQTEDYVHRIGRTGRAKNTGIAISVDYKPKDKNTSIYLRIAPRSGLSVKKGLDVFEQRQNEANFDFISANIEANGKPLVSPYTMKQIKGLDVAFVGLCAPKTIMRSDSAKLPPGIEVKNPIIAAQRILPKLAKKADLLVVLSTCGDGLDSALACARSVWPPL